jgi:hypothetical protein
MIMFGFELADRLPNDAVTVNSLHPATYMPTKMVLDSIGHSIDTLETGLATASSLIPRSRASPDVSTTASARPARTVRHTTPPPAHNSGRQRFGSYTLTPATPPARC